MSEELHANQIAKGSYIAQADHGAIATVNIHQHLPTVWSHDRLRLLAKVRAFWITGVLEQSLHGAALIALGLDEQSDAVAKSNPWKLVVQQPDQHPLLLGPGTKIEQVYKDANGELLILGEPGSGKTTLLLELARHLLDSAEFDETHPMPVVFNLSSWAVKQQSIIDWLVEELNSKYQVPPKLGQSWVDQDQILPLFDGLDEVRLEDRPACIDAINVYRREHGLVPMVVCCRIADYQAQETRLLLHSAVTVQPLTQQQIDDYLSSAGEKLAALRVALRDDPALQELAAKPLMLSVLTLAYQEKPVEDLPGAGSPEIQRQQVFATYIKRMLFQPRGSEPLYTSEQTVHWLACLARYMAQRNQTEFYIEDIQPDWLSEDRLCKLLYGAGVRLTVGLVSGLFAGLVVGLVDGIANGLNNGLVSGVNWGLYRGGVFGLVYLLVFGLIIRVQTVIKPAEIVVWSWGSVWRRLLQIKHPSIVCLFGPVYWSVIWPLALTAGFEWTNALIVGVLGGLLGWLLSGLASGVVSEWSREMPHEHTHIMPNQGIWHAVQNSLLVGLVFGLVGILAFGLFFGMLAGAAFSSYYGLVNGLGEGLNFGLLTALVFGPFFGLVFGLLFFSLSYRMQTAIKPSEIIARSWRSVWHRAIWIGFLRNVLVIGLISFLVQMPDFGLVTALNLGLLFGLQSALFYELINWLVSGLSSETMDEHTRIKPNQGIWHSVRNSVLVGLVFGCAGVLFFWPIFWTESNWSRGLFAGLIVATIMALTVALPNGGFASIQHFVLRLFLWRTGYVPRKYSHFLDHAAERILLRKVGGGYIFVHRLLLEYFAATMDTTSTDRRIAGQLQDVTTPLSQPSVHSVPPVRDVPRMSEIPVRPAPISEATDLLPCGHMHRANARFCSICGEAVPPSSIDGNSKDRA